MAVLTEEDDDDDDDYYYYHYHHYHHHYHFGSIMIMIYINQDINDSQNGCIFSFPILGKSDKIPCVNCPNFGGFVKNCILAFPFHQEEIFTPDPATFHEAPHS